MLGVQDVCEWGPERLHRFHTHKASPAWSLGSRTQGIAFPEAGAVSGEVWRRQAGWV